jgi:subfamily B ATP-binding cassette protein MsbA
MLVISWKLSLSVFFVLPFILFATRKFQKSMKVAFNEVRAEVANLNSFVQERITGMKIVQIFNREKIEYDNFIEINKKHKKAWLKTVWYNSIFFPIAELSTSVTVGLIVWYGGLNSILEDSDITLGIIFLFIQLSQMLFRPLRQIADKFNTLQMGMVAANRVFKILDTESKILNSGNLSYDSFFGNIKFNNITFSYNEGADVLKDISFNVNKGEKIAIVGATGSGKTTIINLLTRFYQTTQGSIEIDDININNMDLNSLRSNIALVLQDDFLFADSLLNNITIWDKTISFDNVVKAAKKIGIHDFIMSLPNGYNYNVKERGVMISQGQRQLISFLRAYLKNPSILILDEATSSIDSNSEELIQSAILKITENKTSIIIAHRLSTILNSDRILVMDSGKLVEHGSHLELINKKEGYYKNLYEIQFKSSEIKPVQLQS